MARLGTTGGEGVIHATISDRIDVLSKNAKKRVALLKELKDWRKDYFDIFKKYSVLQTNAEIKHYMQHWFNYDKKGWWKTHPNAHRFEKIHRQGMIEALQISVENDIPMETYWITGLRDFRIYICWSRQQVTRLILTPYIPEMTGQEIKRLTEKQSIRVVRYLDPTLDNVNKIDGVHEGEELMYTHDVDDKIGVLEMKGEPDKS